MSAESNVIHTEVMGQCSNKQIYQTSYWIGKRKKQTEIENFVCVCVWERERLCVYVYVCARVSGISVWKLDAGLCRSRYRDNAQPIHTS